MQIGRKECQDLDLGQGQPIENFGSTLLQLRFLKLQKGKSMN